MAKKDSKFNFGASAAAQEINEEMISISQSPVQPSFGKKRGSARTKTKDWTLVQSRLPNDIDKRMKLYCVENDITINDFVAEAVKRLLESVGR